MGANLGSTKVQGSDWRRGTRHTPGGGHLQYTQEAVLRGLTVEGQEGYQLELLSSCPCPHLFQVPHRFPEHDFPWPLEHLLP